MTTARDAAAAGEAALSAEAAAVRERFARFATDEAPGRSDVYEAWAAGVASDAGTASLLARIPASRRQPPLVFAVTRLLGAPLGGFAAWSQWLGANIDAVVVESGRRGLQTNEPLRCAALLPALSTIEGPIALLEIGASAGLCLYPDRYSYRYRGDRTVSLDPADGESAVILECDLRGAAPLGMPEVVWRAGLDLDPLDAGDPSDRRFLTTLVWPGEEGRAERIDAALDIVAADPPRIVAGDASDPAVLRALAAEAPAGATLVVTTPGVLPHIPRAGRERLIETLAALPAVWISIDPPGLHEAWHPPVDAATWGGFVLGRDARPLAAVDPLGAFVEWRA
ncbi:DUF2332 domain-containing protein [Microbacterium sp. 4R-513]|uniref:DUF2332 domain-containing protein n=1 Tax=Microbacterium sp. 4R-513 TaxID=2567934 RepID=UPI0013E0F0ED|nr:DUF2332 domain-containing protein [Microbacterium sp. 4R-513]QIG40012.1 DUF2332 domain-containing protein [Microbacterium sp. 4R-513]